MPDLHAPPCPYCDEPLAHVEDEWICDDCGLTFELVYGELWGPLEEGLPGIEDVIVRSGVV